MADKKWYNAFISFDNESEAPAPPDDVEFTGRTGEVKIPPKTAPSGVRPPVRPSAGAARPAAGPAQRVADIAKAVPPTPPIKAVDNPNAFDQIYAAAGITTPPHGYSIFKIADMLQSEHIKDLPAQGKRGSVLVALDAAGVKLQEIIEDAVRRDRALDTYERVQQRGVEELEKLKAKENEEIQAAIDRLVAEHQAKIKANNEAITRARERFESWLGKKHEEEERISEAVAPFVTPNPITTGAGLPPGAVPSTPRES